MTCQAVGQIPWTLSGFSARVTFIHMNSVFAKPVNRDLSGSLAIVVDGDPTSRSVLINHLRDFGMGEIAHFGRIRDARKFLETKKADFVLCEQTFRDDKDATGQDLLDDLRRSQLLPYSSVFIIVTGEATYAKVAEAAESALDGYLLKPHKPGLLYERLVQAKRRKAALKPIFEPMEAEDYDRAAKVCELFFQKKMDYHVFAARLGADLLLRIGKHDEAKKLYEAVVEETDLPWAKLGVARALLEAGKVTQSLAKLKALIDEDPRYVDVYDVLGRVHVEAGDYPKAVEAYKSAAELTPGSIARVQKFGIMSFYQGDDKAAYKALSHCAILGVDSKMFDYQSYVLLAFCCWYAKDRKLLNRCLQDMVHVVERQPGSARLHRFKVIVTIVAKLMADQRDAAADLLGSLSSDVRAAGFDFEAACNMILVTAEVRAAGQALPEADDWIKTIALRYCRSRSLTEQLLNSARKHPPFQELIKACNAEIGELAANSMSLSLDGDHRGAVERLYEQGQTTLNAKLIENAYMVLQRYGDTMDDVAPLRDKLMALRGEYGVNPARDQIGRETVRRGGAATLKTLTKSDVVQDDVVEDSAGPVFAE